MQNPLSIFASIMAKKDRSQKKQDRTALETPQTAEIAWLATRMLEAKQLGQARDREADLERAMKSIAGVGKVYIYKKRRGLGSMDVAITAVGNPPTLPTQALIVAAQVVLDDEAGFWADFHRTNFADLLNTELWVLVEVARQMVELPTSDYTAVEVQVLRALTDDNGDVVIDIPFTMRSVETPNNEKLVYTVGYYASEVTKNISDASFPANYISGLRTIYVRPS